MFRDVIKGMQQYQLLAKLQLNSLCSRALLFCLIIAGMLGLQYGMALAGTATVKSKKTTFTMWQLPSQTDTIGMSYVIRTVSGKIIVLDGGFSSDAPYLKSFLGRFGGNVDAWFISHAHDDHFNALKEILLNPGDIKIKNIYASLSDEAWVKQYEPDALEALQQFNLAVHSSHKTVTEVTPGEVINIDGVRVEILSIKNPEINFNAINNSSVVYRMSDKQKSILFLGDLGVEGGEKLLHSKYGNRIHSDYVQMAHHGQNGVNEAFYQAVKPLYCLWPTPSWLWDNNYCGKGKNSGSWLTLEVRNWMNNLHVKRNYVAWRGLSRVD